MHSLPCGWVEDYLLKPIDPDDLELQLKSLTEKVAQGKENDFAAYVRQWFNLDIRPKEIAPLPQGEVCYFIFAEVGAAASLTYGEFSPGVQFWKGEYLCVVGSNTGEVENRYRTFYR